MYASMVPLCYFFYLSHLSLASLFCLSLTSRISLFLASHSPLSVLSLAFLSLSYVTLISHSSCLSLLPLSLLSLSLSFLSLFLSLSIASFLPLSSLSCLSLVRFSLLFVFLSFVSLSFISLSFLFVSGVLSQSSMLISILKKLFQEFENDQQFQIGVACSQSSLGDEGILMAQDLGNGITCVVPNEEMIQKLKRMRSTWFWWVAIASWNTPLSTRLVQPHLPEWPRNLLLAQFSASQIAGSYGMMYSHHPWNQFLNWYPIPCLMKSLFWPSSKFDVRMYLGQFLVTCRSWQEQHNSREIIGKSQLLDFLIQCGECSLIQHEKAVSRMQSRCFIRDRMVWWTTH